MNKLLIFLLSLVVISCSDAKKMQKILDRNPDWITTTTHTDTITHTIPIHDSILIQYSSIVNIDSLLDEFADSAGYIKKSDCKHVATIVYRDKKVNIDTTYNNHYLQDSVTVDLEAHIWTKDGKLYITNTVTSKSLHTTSQTTINPPPPISFFQCILIWMGWILLFLIIAAIVAKMLKVNIPFLK